jgi:hypothetical protein
MVLQPRETKILHPSVAGRLSEERFLQTTRCTKLVSSTYGTPRHAQNKGFADSPAFIEQPDVAIALEPRCWKAGIHQDPQLARSNHMKAYQAFRAK